MARHLTPVGQEREDDEVTTSTPTFDAARQRIGDKATALYRNAAGARESFTGVLVEEDDLHVTLCRRNERQTFAKPHLVNLTIHHKEPVR